MFCGFLHSSVSPRLPAPLSRPDRRRVAASCSGVAMALLLLAGTALSAAGQDVVPTPAPAPTPPPAAGAGAQGAVPVGTRFLRASLESAVLLGVGAAQYWADGSTNSRDWDYEWSWETWKAKLVTFEAVRYDDNSLFLNVGHSASSGLFYLLGRGAGLGVGHSLLVATAGSLAWEYAVEFKEVVSINDVILGSVGGLALMEPVHQIGELLNRSRPTWGKWTLGTIFGFAGKLNRALYDDLPPSHADSYDRFGFAADVEHRFAADLGGGQLEPERGADAVGAWGAEVVAEICSLRRDPAAGPIVESVTDAPLISAAVSVLQGPDGTHELRVVTGVVVTGVHRRGAIAGWGTSVLAGLGSGFEYTSGPSAGGGETDHLAILNVAGPVVEVVATRSGAALRAGVALYADFAESEAYAFRGFREAAPSATVRSTLELHGYYHAWGATAAAHLELRLGQWELAIEGRRHWLDSIDSRDRYTDFPGDGLALRDEASRARARLAFMLPGDATALSVSYTEVARWGRVEELAAHRDERRFTAGVSARF